MFTETVAGHRVSGRCVRDGAGKARRARCSLSVALGTVDVAGRAGVNRVAFTGRFSRRHHLAPGRYTLVITATNAEGTATSRLSFTVVNG